MHSCIYEGIVTHHRHHPVAHRFRYRLFMVYLDLDELPRLAGSQGLVSSCKYGARAFLRGDHLFDAGRPLGEELRDVVRSATGQQPAGPVRLLTQLRHFGYYLSPLNLYYVFDSADQRVESVVAEVNNTPWNERHGYVLWDGNRVGDTTPLRFAHTKQFHVSPFMSMDLGYRWCLSEPGPDLRVHIANMQGSQRWFDARMALDRRCLDRRQLGRMTFRYPLITAQIAAAIYFQAWKLWWKKCPFYAHPESNQPRSTSPDHSATSLPRRASITSH